ncbi:MAG: glycosyltransferase [Symploca sp. SIO3C6]|nr:glycosyltransferase [Symploca sp. SIO3C6]NET04129.1 glycosyltransferase [Symploca sp. SIO2B6]
MNILFLTTIIPRKKRMGSEVASQCFIDALTQSGYQVSVIGYMRTDDIFELNPQEILVDKRYIETKRAKFYPLLWLILSILRGLPYSAAKYYSKAYIKIVKKLLATSKYDAVIIDHPQLGWLESLMKDKGRMITIAHNIEHEIYLDNYKNAGNFISRWIYRREAYLIKQMEDKLATTARAVWALTEHDSKYFSSLEGAAKIRVSPLPPGLDKLPDKPISKEFDIGLIGSWPWKPNQEGLQWFLQNVYPHLPTSLSIHVAGRGAQWLIEKYPNIHYRGFVPDAQEFMAQAKVVAIPILSGGGIQIKTLDAIASGSAIVATPVALRGIPDYPQTVQVAAEPEDFAKFLISVISSPATQQKFDDAFNWFTTRREQFLADIACAIKEL